MNELLKMTGITKTFPGVYALDGVDLELYRGEVLALLGENGAGKSTLLKVLSGVYTPDAGEIYVDGTKKVFKEPADAAAEGIRIIYQEINSYDELTVAENIFVNNEPKKGGLVDWKEMNSRAEALLKRLNEDIEPTRIVGGLSTAQKQLIEIARALANDIRILVMDEPTSALSDTEVDALLKLVKELAKEGISVIYISHKLDELYTVATRVQIMRDGKRVGVRMLAQTPQEELVRLMVGREIRDMYPKVEIPRGETVLEVQNLTNQKIHDISFEVHAGEILGIFGLTVCLKLPAFIVTIGTQQIFSGLAYLVFNSPQKVFTNPDLQKIGKISIGGVSVVFLYFVVFLLLAAFVLKYTTYGRKIYAVGANAAASRFAGINVGRIQLSVFAICGFMTSIAAVLSTAVNYAGVANVGETFTTDAISSAVLGGFSLAGGRGNMIGIFFGVLLLRMITNGMNLLGVQTYWQMLIKGLILVLALIVDVLESRKK